MKHLQQGDLGPDDPGSYVLMENLYAAQGKWQDKAKVRELMNYNGLKKPPGSSRIEVDGSIHEFVAGDSNHCEAEIIYEKLDEIKQQLNEEGYIPKVSEVMLEIDDQFKTHQLWHHSEKLAVAYGLIRTNPRSEIRIVKNLRSCEDCHELLLAPSLAILAKMMQIINANEEQGQHVQVQKESLAVWGLICIEVFFHDLEAYTFFLLIEPIK
ncbi:hypothetical protein SAY86_002004 [Trapa natans]|uniref:DYW domain-containing protein n=1 Tax=Trapa natans TaxID=22666 RepID=A0AAN7R228_TRANT|nr:hypothetical protein SAY86_002004 [Trapa natans]